MPLRGILFKYSICVCFLPVCICVKSAVKPQPFENRMWMNDFLSWMFCCCQWYLPGIQSPISQLHCMHTFAQLCNYLAVLLTWISILMVLSQLQAQWYGRSQCRRNLSSPSYSKLYCFVIEATCTEALRSCIPTQGCRWPGVGTPSPRPLNPRHKLPITSPTLCNCVITLPQNKQKIQKETTTLCPKSL